MTIILGCKFTGEPQHHTDTQAGTYWEVLPQLSEDAERLQRSLLRKPAPNARRVRRMCWPGRVGTGQ